MLRYLTLGLALIVFCSPVNVCTAQPPAVAALPATLRPVPRADQWWQHRHDAMNKRIVKGNVDLIFVGDSITQGWEGPGREVWEKYYSKRNAVNLGISGDRTQHVLWRLANGNIKDISPKLAVVLIGTNNSGDDSSDEIADGVTEIVKTLRKKLPDTKVLVLAIFSRGPNREDARRKVNEGANAIFEKLDENKMVYYLNINDKFLAADGTLPVAVMPDLLHPKQKGYQIWAEAIEPTVKKLMGEK